jgi:hypothetical protein
LDVNEDAAVTSLTLALQECAFAPFEVSAQVEILIHVAGDYVSEAIPGYVNDAFLDLEDMIGVGVEARAADECIEVAEVMAVEQRNRSLVWWDLLCTSRKARYEGE